MRGLILAEGLAPGATGARVARQQRTIAKSRTPASGFSPWASLLAPRPRYPRRAPHGGMWPKLLAAAALLGALAPPVPVQAQFPFPPYFHGFNSGNPSVVHVGDTVTETMEVRGCCGFGRFQPELYS
jgi:hypothetical protein